MSKMATFLSENLNESEVVNDGATRLHGYSLTATGTEDRYVTFMGGEQKSVIVVPAGREVSLSGLNEPFPDGLSVESKVGDGKLIANVGYESREGDNGTSQTQPETEEEDFSEAQEG